MTEHGDLPGEKVGVQEIDGDDKICLWARVDPDQEPMERVFAVYRTGEEADGNYLDSVVVGGSSRHLFTFDAA